MFKVSFLFALAFVAAVVVSFVSGRAAHGFGHAVSQLDRYQTAGGGFVLSPEPGAKPSLEATSHALFLSSLFGLRKKINSNEVPRYIQTLENGDYGYGKSAGLASDLESVRHAVLSYQHLALSIPNSGNVATFIKSLYDADTHLFANRVGETGDLKSTAIAFQTLEYLGELQRAWVQDMVESVRTYLAKHIKLGNIDIHFEFAEEKSLSVISANYYGIVLGSYVGTDFVNFAKWAAFIISLQKEDGGFGTLENTVHAVSSLRILQQLKAASTKEGQADKNAAFVDRINTENLMQYVSNIPSDLRSAAQAHLAVALTKSFTQNFDTEISYEVLRSSVSVEKRIVQGTQLKPILTVKTFDGVAHAGLDVEVSIAYESSSEVVTAKLQWKDAEQYTADEFFETAGQLGSMKFNFVIRCYVVGVGEISFEKSDVKQIGYGLMVDSQARLDVTGKEFKEGETVAIGTDFNFGLTLQNHTHEQFVSGDFNVIFTVLDSSLIAVHTKTIDARKNTAPISFAFALKNSNIPAGTLSFRFDVASSRGVHTTEIVSYQLSFPMIATAITFEGFKANEAPKYKVGETIKVSVEPATFPDLRTVYGYPATDINGKTVGDSRHFFMDVTSPSGALLRTVPGHSKSTTGNSKYLFEVPVTPSLDSLGTNIVSFRYVSAAKEEIPLGNYDSFYGELYEDSNVLNYTVSAELHMVEVKERPNTNDYYYGNDINFRFRVKDAISNHYIERGSDEQANVYLALQHKDEDRARPFTSALEAASEVETGGVKEFVINWAINPNAVQGPGFLTVSAKDADGNHVPLFAEGSNKQPVRFDVTIGGSISVDSRTYSTSEATFAETAFVVQFTLACQEKSLRDAQLRCSVVYNDESKPLLSALPAATNDEGVYSISWSLPHKDAPSGSYDVKCYRETDRKRALEAKELQDKKRRLEAELKQFEDTGVHKNATDADDQKETSIEDTLAPLFVIHLSHSAAYTGRIPLRTEMIAALVLGALFFFASYKKKIYIPTPATN